MNAISISLTQIARNTTLKSGRIVRTINPLVPKRLVDSTLLKMN